MRRIALVLFLLLSARSWGQAGVYSRDILSASPSVYLRFNDASGGFRDSVTGNTFSVAGAGTTLYRQTGFDSKTPSNTSAAFAYNSKAVSPNNTLGDFEWSTPIQIHVHINNLSFQRNWFTRLELASKGPMGGNLSPSDTTSKGWDLYIWWISSGARLCLMESAAANTSSTVGFLVCSNSDMLNGYGYDLDIVSDGSGSPSGVSMVINGSASNTTNYLGSGLGGVSVALSGGTGYANTTAFTSSGGGAHCTVTGTMTSASGVPSSVSFNNNSGCTSTPTLTLTSPRGTGVTLTPTLINSSISTSSPLIIAGDVSDAVSSQGARVHNAVGIVLDEFAMFSPASTAKAYKLFADSQWWQNVTLPTTPVNMIFDNDGCADSDNLWALAIAIRLHQLGVVKLRLVNNTVTQANDTQTYRSMLDYAGLAHVPVSVSTVKLSLGGPCSNIAVYSGSVRSQASYATDVTALRKALVNSSEKVAYVLGGSYASLAALLASGADSISPLTGQRLVQAKVSAVYTQSGYSGSPITGDNNIGESWASANTAFAVLESLGVPMYLTGSVAPDSGPSKYSRGAKDPFTLALVQGSINTRSAWDSMTVLAPVLPSLFASARTGTITMTGSSSSWSLTVTAGAGHGVYQTLANTTTAKQQVYTWLINSLAGDFPVPPRRLR